MEEPYVKKYSSSYYYWLYFMAAVYVVSFLKLYQYYGVSSKREDFIVFLCILMVFTLMTVLAMILKYRTVYLYNDRLVMQNFFKKELMEIQFDNIARMGFLNATTDSINNSAGSSQALELVILLKDGGSEQLDSTIITDMDMIYTFISERMTED